MPWGILPYKEKWVKATGVLLEPITKPRLASLTGDCAVRLLKYEIVVLVPPSTFRVVGAIEVWPACSFSMAMKATTKE